MASDFETKLTYTYGIAVASTVLSGLWIVWLLIQIEVNKSFMTMDIDNPLELDVEDEANGPAKVEIEPEVTNNNVPDKELPKPRRRRVPMNFKLMQFTSVGVLILLTYLLLVVSPAPLWLSSIGSFSVLAIFLRYQIGDELRRRRFDRMALIISLFMLIAGSLSMATYAQKTLSQGEIYEGPARIVAYDGTSYNNSQQDHITRTDLMVSWGKSWGCPLSGGKVCQAHVKGAMCQAGPPGDTTNPTNSPSKDGYGNRNGGDRRLANSASTSSANATDLEEDLEDEEKTAEELQQENEALAEHLLDPS
jgi:hypothetical protein